MTAQMPTDTPYPLESTDGASSIEKIDYATKGDSFWTGLAQSNFETARNYQDASLTVQWERNADHFNNRHFRRSAYNSRLYKGRSRLFRPLTRASERASSAQAAAALFSNIEIVDIQPENQNDPEQVLAAKIIKGALEYRLKKSIKWYLTCMGAWQDTRVYGPCYTYTDWEYEEAEIEVDEIQKNIVGTDDTKGRTKKVKKTVIVKDRPVIDMIPVENLLLDPACDWRDPIGSSPYVVRLVPMYVTDIEARMEATDDKTGKPQWKKLSRGVILSSQRDVYNTVRQAREGDNRPDKTDSQEQTEFKVMWAHENFVRIGGEEFVYWTLGTEHMLTDVTPLREAYVVNERPFTYGFSVIEAHRFSPSSPTDLISNIQIAINDTANLRLDNVRLALNKRYILRRGATVDLEALMRSVPGGGVMTDDPERDIKVVETRDVTGSSYKEQERLESESGDITGSLLGQAVQNNRQITDSVGGMEMLAEGANAISEFDIRTFAETWVKPQLELLIRYIQAYESDEVILNTAYDDAVKKGGWTQRIDNLDRDSIMNRVMNEKMTVNVNVGLGATSPQRKVATLSKTIEAVGNLPEMAGELDSKEIAKEMFAAAGFQDGARFLKKKEDGEEPEITQQDLEAAMQQGAEQAVDQTKMADIEMRREVEFAKLELQREMGYAGIAAKENITMAQLQNKLDIDLAKDKSRRDVAAAQEATKREVLINQREELNFKKTTGLPGI
ncbi:MAG: hypothetical protein MJK15_00820 [Colwellia sp.]|nr:hypothetical protein [Colwellia sp.]